MTRHPWADAEDAVIAAGYREGRTDAQIAALLCDRTRSAVTHRRTRLGLTSERWTVDRDHLRRLDAAGASVADISAATGATTRTVQQLRYVLGLTRGRPSSGDHR